MDINFDDIEIMHPDSGGGSVFYYRGRPFTGTIVEYKNNLPIGEISVVNGHTQGRVAACYDNGRIKEEYYEKYNRMYGFYKQRDEKGQPVCHEELTANGKLT